MSNKENSVSRIESILEDSEQLDKVLAEKIMETRNVRVEIEKLIVSILITAPFIGNGKKLVKLFDWLLGFYFKGQKTISLDKVMKYWRKLQGE